MRVKFSLKRLSNNRSIAAIGIGAMIVFIAMVLVAGIAASVLIQTSTQLESQSLTTGQETISEVATGIAVFDIVGYAPTTLITQLGITVRARAGSQDINLNTTYIEISDTDQKVILTYSGHHDGWNDSTLGVDNIFGTSNLFPAADRFGIMVIEDKDGSCTQSNPVINKGDKVILAIDTNNCFSASGIAERKDIRGNVVPEGGSPGVIAFTSPATYGSTTNNIFDLQ